MTCEVGASCEAYITVAVIGSVNIPTQSAACPMGPTWGAATCAQCFGGGISSMCCNMGFKGGFQRLPLMQRQHAETRWERAGEGKDKLCLPSDNHPMIFKSFSAKLLRLQLSVLAV